nr:MAG TPA: hypothetical protein [Caudoviricetes sp.]
MRKINTHNALTLKFIFSSSKRRYFFRKTALLCAHLKMFYYLCSVISNKQQTIKI